MSGHTSPQRSGRFHADMDAGTITVVVGGIVTVITVFVGGLWNYLSGRKKSGSDAQTTTVSGFIALITQLQTERTAMIARLEVCEDKEERLDRRITQLERALIRENIDLPPEEP